MKEADLKRNVMAYLSRLPNGFFFKLSSPFLRGLPDIIGCYKGRFVGMELKIKSKKPTPLQYWYLERIKKAGGMTGVVRSLEEAEQLIEEAKRLIEKGGIAK